MSLKATDVDSEMSQSHHDEPGPHLRQVYDRNALAAMIYTLSTLQYVQDPDPLTTIDAAHVAIAAAGIPTQLTDQVRKHHALLTTFALILVSRDKGDVAAVSLLLKEGGVPQFWYAKNRPVIPAERQYVEKLARVVRNEKQHSKIEVIRQLRDLIFRFCSSKIQGRTKKIVWALNELRKSITNKTGTEAMKEVAKNLAGTHAEALTLEMHKHDPFSSKKTFVHALVFLLSKVENHTREANTASLCKMASTLSRTMTAVLPRPPNRLLHQLKRLAAYHEAIILLSGYATNPGAIQSNQRASFTISDVYCKAPESIPVPNTLNAINIFSREYLGMEHLDITSAMLHRYLAQKGSKDTKSTAAIITTTPSSGYHPTKETPASGTSIINLSSPVHCECTLALHMISLIIDQHAKLVPGVERATGGEVHVGGISQPQPRVYIELGCSKLSCYLCHNFLAYLSANTRVTFITNGSHRKIPRTWAMPCISRPAQRAKPNTTNTMPENTMDNVLAPALKRMTELVSKQLKMLIFDIKQRRASDTPILDWGSTEEVGDDEAIDEEEISDSMKLWDSVVDSE